MERNKIWGWIEKSAVTPASVHFHKRRSPLGTRLGTPDIVLYYSSITATIRSPDPFDLHTNAAPNPDQQGTARPSPRKTPPKESANCRQEDCNAGLHWIRVDRTVVAGDYD